MARIPLVTIEKMTSEEREQYDRFPSNLTRALLVLPGRLARALPEEANALRASGLAAKTREGVILRVAALSDSAYERMQHLGEAKTSGWTDDEIRVIESGDEAWRLGTFAHIMRFVDECVASPHVSEEAFTDARALLSDQDLATVIALVGHYMAVARYVEVLGVELDAKPDTWATEH